MRPASRKYRYARHTLGEWVARSRGALGWSYRQVTSAVAARTGAVIHAGTLLHVERGERSLPADQRRALAGVLIAARRAQIATRITPAPVRPAPEALAAAVMWPDARRLAHARALAAADRGDWSAWAFATNEVGAIDLTMGHLDTAARLLDGALEVDARLIDPPTLAGLYVTRGWVAMELSQFQDATTLLTRAARMLSSGGRGLDNALHFLGRVYCAVGVITDDEAMREVGRRHLARAQEYARRRGADNGYHLLQQITSLIHDDPHLAWRYLDQSREALGGGGTANGHYFLSRGLLELDTHPADAREFFTLARDAYSERRAFYPRGVGSALRSLSGLWEDERATLPDAAAHALVAALVHPYRQSFDRLETVAARVYVMHCDSVARRYAAFWHEQGERVARMSEPPYILLRGLLAAPGGAKFLRVAAARADVALRRAVNEWNAWGVTDASPLALDLVSGEPGGV